MNQGRIDWNKDLPAESEEEYQALVRSLLWTDGFDLLFVRCSPAEGERLIARVKKDIPKKNIEVLCLQQPVDNFYKIIEELENRDEIDILFITGLEYSFYEYEDTKRMIGWTSKDIYSYSWKGVPRILINLNQQRERFRDSFNICFVFLVPLFVIKYFIQRAPDFFDWRSGLLEFPTDAETVEQESFRILREGDYAKYLALTTAEKNQKILEIKELLEENYQKPRNKADLLFKQGNLFVSAKEYEEAIAAYNKALKIKPDKHEAWNNQGIALRNLGRYEEAIASYDKALKIKPDYLYGWNNRGVVLRNLGRYEEAIAAYDKALKIKPDYHYGWNNRGNALSYLGRYEDAIASYNQALKIKPDYYEAWNNQGIALFELGRYEEANASFYKATELKPDNHQFLYKLDSVLSDLGSHEEDNPIRASMAEELAHYWRKRLAEECPEQSLASRESIIFWLIGSHLKRFEMLNDLELNIAKQAMEYRYRILQQRYLGISRERAYRNLITRLGSLLVLRNKIQTWVAKSRERQRSVLDVLQEVIQELLQSDNYMQQQMASITEFTTDVRLRNALLFASTEEYCLRPVRNQPLLVYRFVNYLRRTQRGGLTQVPSSDLIRLVSEEMLTEDSDNRVNLVDSQEIAEYEEAQEPLDRQVLRNAVKQEFERYLAEHLEPEAVKWLQLYLQGKSQNQIAKILNKPLKDIYRLREKISYHAVRVFALKGQPELVDSWLSNSFKEHNLGLTPQQFGVLVEQLTPMQRQILELRKAGNNIEDVAQELKLKTYQVIGEWTKVYLVAQALRTQE